MRYILVAVFSFYLCTRRVNTTTPEPRIIIEFSSCLFFFNL